MEAADTGTVAQCSLCDWQRWITPCAEAATGSQGRALAVLLGHVALSHPESYDDMVQAVMEQEAEEMRKKVKPCDKRTHKGQDFVTEYPKGWKCLGCGQYVTGRQLEQLLKDERNGENGK